ncbi:Protein of unknown function DUF2625 [Frankineae bacterium MT45]|nr:Protein of unknown function DUF2625 [Frankineae bacterium MT45]
MTEWRSAAELRNVADPAWPGIEQQIVGSSLTVEVVAADASAGARALEQVQVTTRSVLGALTSECGAVRIDQGWLRVLGAGADGLGSVGDMTKRIAVDGQRFLVVAIDALGGYFAVNGGDLPGELAEVAYWGPDTLSWTPIGLGHAAFLSAMLAGAVTDFYAPVRWPDWEAEVAPLPLAYGLSVYPFPFTAEGQDLGLTSRTPVPLLELIDIYADLARQVGDLPNASRLRVETRE